MRPTRILCLTTLPTLGAGNRLRVEQYVPFLRERGIELTISPFFDDRTYGVLYQPGRLAWKALGVVRGLVRRARDAVRARRYDAVLVYRESAPLGPPLFERLLRWMRVPYALDFDDAIFLGPIHPVNRRWAWLRHPARVAETTRLAAAVMVQNKYLAEWARRWHDDVTVIPTAIDIRRHFRRGAHQVSRPTVIGWVGSTTTAPYLHLLDEAIDLVAQRRDVLVRVIGGQYAHPRARVECWPYRLDSEPRDVATFDIGVLPEPDDPWTRGKGALKGIIYMATGVPVVASRIGVNPIVIPHGVTGYCVDSPQEWADALERLIDDPDLRTTMGIAGREHVIRNYSIEAQGSRLAEVLARAASMR